MAELSPAAQAVINATAERVLADRRINMEHIAAAALRAAADQVVPAGQSTERRAGGLGPGDRVWDDRTAAICRRKLLAIAAELEGTDAEV